MSAMVHIAPVAVESPLVLLNLDQVRIDPKWALKVPASLATRKHILPLSQVDGVVLVACTNSIDPQTQQVLERHLSYPCQYVLADSQSLKRAMDRVYQPFSLGDVETRESSVRLRDDSLNAVAICDQLFQAAILRDASDIHLVPNERALAVHLRVDGELEAYCELNKEVQPLVLSRLKVLAGMDIAEKRSAQDGRIHTYYGSDRRRLEVRAASLPTRYGERLTLRLLTNNATGLSLSSLGMREQSLQVFQAATERPHGLILLTGPTGSGKSTTLYVAIDQLLKSRGGNVITIEDPIEYEIQGASQVEVDSADKVNFSKALRSILRHDPDVVMLGEIRDEETASIAIKAALTGHLVFSTLHTNTAVGVVTRLIDMGIEPFLVAATVRVAVAQRLVRKLCQHCRRQREISLQEALLLHNPRLEGQTTFDAIGCVNCAGKGYSGRIGLFEMFQCTPETAKLIAEGANETQVTQEAMRCRNRTLLDDGIAKVLDGTTTVAEVAAAVALG
ncbi:MAG: type II/IV secretion system protein [Pirellulaceae bacterium]|nr:type II/IV secretion system protein [Pirellulaceae bacterium]